MIKGILALFRLGIILNPFVLMGIIMGFFIAFAPDKEVFERLFKQNSFYALLFLASFLYNFLLKKVYKEKTYELDYVRMSFNIVLSVVKFGIATFFSVVFVMFFLTF